LVIFPLVYALKKISKAHVVAHSQQARLNDLRINYVSLKTDSSYIHLTLYLPLLYQTHHMNEKKVMDILNHPFLVKLYATFRDDEFVYMLLELCNGGELFTLLRAHICFPLKTAQFYAASVIYFINTA